MIEFQNVHKTYRVAGKEIPALHSTDLRVENVVTIALVAFAMCTIATIYPAWRASRTDPAAALRYE